MRLPVCMSFRRDGSRLTHTLCHIRYSAHLQLGVVTNAVAPSTIVKMSKPSEMIHCKSWPLPVFLTQKGAILPIRNAVVPRMLTPKPPCRIRKTGIPGVTQMPKPAKVCAVTGSCIVAVCRCACLPRSGIGVDACIGTRPDIYSGQEGCGSNERATRSGHFRR